MDLNHRKKQVTTVLLSPSSNVNGISTTSSHDDEKDEGKSRPDPPSPEMVVLVFGIMCLAAALLMRLANPQQSGVTIVSASASASASASGAGGSNTRGYHPTGPARFRHEYDCQHEQILEEADLIFVKTSTTPSFQMSIHDPAIDQAVSKPIAETGCWECGMISDLQNSLSTATATNAHGHSAWFLDIGTNIGMWTLSVAAAGFQTYSLEPFPANYQKICQSIRKNQFQRSKVYTMAATRSKMQLRLEMAEAKNFGSVAIREQTSKDDDKTNGNHIMASGLPVDDLIPFLPMDRPVAIKLDVEGAELEALMGMQSFLKQANIVHFAMELRTNLLRYHPDEIQTIASILDHVQNLTPYRRDDQKAWTELDPNEASTWQHFKHPKVRYFDVVWKKKKTTTTTTSNV